MKSGRVTEGPVGKGSLMGSGPGMARGAPVRVRNGRAFSRGWATSQHQVVAMPGVAPAAEVTSAQTGERVGT